MHSSFCQSVSVLSIMLKVCMKNSTFGLDVWTCSQIILKRNNPSYIYTTSLKAQKEVQDVQICTHAMCAINCLLTYLFTYLLTYLKQQKTDGLNDGRHLVEQAAISSYHKHSPTS